MSEKSWWHRALWLEGAEAKADGWHEASEAIWRALQFGIETEREARLSLALAGYSPENSGRVFTDAAAVYGPAEDQ